MNDLEFARSCSRGNRRAWEEFINKYSGLIYHYIQGVLKLKGLSLSAQNIIDLRQDLFLLLFQDNFKKLKSFKAKNGCSLASWLRQVAINYTIDYLRKSRLTLSLDEEDENGLRLEEVLADNSVSICDILINKEKLTQLEECIERLDKDEKYFLQLHINKDISLDELRGHFRISRSAVDMRKYKILGKLRECFKRKKIWLDF